MRKILIVLISILIVSCFSRNDKKDNSIEKSAQIISELDTAENKIEIPQKHKEIIDYDNLNHDYAEDLKYLDSIYGYTPYIAIFDTMVFYYVSSNNDILKYSKIGLVDKSYNVLLPQKYDFIYNPDEISEGLIVIQQNGKLGLFDYINNKILEPEFDFILPGDQDSKGIAIKGDKKYLINENLTVANTSEPDNYSVVDLFNKDYSLPNKQIKSVFYTYKSLEHWQDIKDTKYIYCPNYLQQFHFFSRIMSFSKDDYDYEHLTLKLQEKFTFDNSYQGILILVDKMETIGSTSGLFKHEDYFLTILKQVNKVTSSDRLHFAYEGNKGGMYGAYYTSRELDNRIIEVKFQESSPEYKKYSSMINYKYFQISTLGNINGLPSFRKFAFTKYALIDSTYFIGKYEKHIGNSEIRNGMWWEAYYEVTNHLSIEDLDIMRNEIFAEYDYKFNSEKWQNYFKKYPHYNPKYNNVEQFLTEIDKKNIQFILDYKKRMIDNEDKFLQKRKETRIENNAG